MDGNTESEPIYYRERERGIPIHGKIKQERERIKSSTHTLYNNYTYMYNYLLLTHNVYNP